MRPRAARATGRGACAPWLGGVWLLLVLLLLAGGCGGPARAQGLESALSPGSLIRGHQKIEGECAKCHVRFDRAAQDRLCIDCHKEVGQDLRARTGWHGRQKPQPCRTCHTDHRGPDMRIAEFDRRSFDHRATDYPLAGKHVSVDCAACHKPGQKWREAPSDCLSCHRKDDRHKGSLGAKCADCHTEQSWKEAKVDHGQTRFPLAGKHAEVKCDACHKSAVYNEAPLTCIGCHRKDDKHKARYGDKCDSCHNARRWGEITFRHDTDTRFVLRGKHREARCDSCHTGHLYRDKVGTACADCHRKDDTHKGALGSNCAACHVESSWRETGRFDHDKTRFKLRGGHVKAECKACHTVADYKAAPSDCVACHKKDDKHEATLGTDCAACHTDVDWKASRFDHARTRFALTHGHAVPPLKCTSCHRDMRSFRPTALECVACHKKDDKHEGQLGARCDSCHGAANWRVSGYDHGRARFALTGGHLKVECKACHKSLRYRDAARQCVGCHLKDDKHRARFGPACESCHNARDWRLWNYEHARRSGYALEGKHVQVACEACHRQPAPAGKTAAPLDRSCASCHRSDDVHDGAFGARCEQCHGTDHWKQVNRRVRTSRAPAGGAAARLSPQRGVVS